MVSDSFNLPDLNSRNFTNQTKGKPSKDDKEKMMMFSSLSDEDNIYTNPSALNYKPTNKNILGNFKNDLNLSVIRKKSEYDYSS